MWMNGKLQITDDYEDIHSFVEANLIDRIGDAGKKLHTGQKQKRSGCTGYEAYIQEMKCLELDESFKRASWKSFLKL